MNIVVFDGYVNNPGDLSWDALKQYGTVTVYDRTPRNELQERARQADIAVSSKVFWDAEALSWAPNLKMIALTSTGRFSVRRVVGATSSDAGVSSAASETCVTE